MTRPESVEAPGDTRNPWSTVVDRLRRPASGTASRRPSYSRGRRTRGQPGLLSIWRHPRRGHAAGAPEVLLGADPKAEGKLHYEWIDLRLERRGCQWDQGPIADSPTARLPWLPNRNQDRQNEEA